MNIDFWDEQRVDQLAAMWCSGRFSFRQIAAIMQTSRCSVAGKVARLGLKRDVIYKAPPAPRKAPKPATNAVRAARIRSRNNRPPTPVKADTPTNEGKPWLERKRGECAFPVGGLGDAVISCCAPSPDSVYCQHHRDLMFVKPAKARNSGETVAA